MSDVPPTVELPVYKRLDLTLVSGEGVYVTDASGRTFLDLYGGHASALLGYRHPELLAALSGQAEALFFQTNAVDVPVRADAAAAVGLYGGPDLPFAFFVNSGAEANENALRLAVRATGRDTIVAFEGAFHGRTSAAASVTWGSEKWYGFSQRPFSTRFVPRDDASAVTAAIDDAVAAVIVEPVQGVAGAFGIPDEVLAAARTACDASGAVLISDEVQCGLGRTGELGAMRGRGIRPDLMTLGKGIAGGFPCAALLLSSALASVVKPGDFGTTFGGGPMACALVAAVAEVVRREDLAERARALHDLIRSTCQVGPIQEIQGRGLLIGMRCDRPAAEVLAALRQRGILAGGSADPHVLRLMPPLTLEPEHVRALAAALEAM